MNRLIYILFILTILIGKSFSADKISIAMVFEPTQLVLGRKGLLNVTVSGSQDAKEPQLPEVEGLIIRPLGTQQSIKMINGNISMNLTYSFTVMPQRLGEFTIPNFGWMIDGKKYSVSSPATKLVVTEANVEEELPLELYVHLDHLRDENIYVGQVVPVQITFIRPIDFLFSVRTDPVFEGNDFVSYGYASNAKSGVQKIDGIDKQVAIINTYVMPLKSGNHSFSYKWALNVQKVKPTSSSQNSFFDSIFGNMIMNNLEEVEIRSKPETIQVLALPEGGKPENFTGAIGQFSVESFSAMPQEVQVGDPITLKMVIKGTGNMDRVSIPLLNIDDNWKSYKPKASFKQEDAFGFSGTKVFEYIIIPQNDRITQTPTLTFSFFNPQTGRYSEIATNPIAIKINPASISSSQSTASIMGQSNHLSSSAGPEVLPIKLTITKSVSSLMSLICYRFFTPLLILVLVIIALLLLIIKNYKLKAQRNLGYMKQVELEKSIQVHFQKIQKAFSKKNSKEFYENASMIILEIIAKSHHKAPQSLTNNEVLELLANKGLSQERIDYTKSIFDTADLLKFSGMENEVRLNSGSLSEFESLINELEKI